MPLEFDFDQLDEDATNLYVGKGRGRTPDFSFVRIDRSVREELTRIVHSTWTAMLAVSANPEPYDPSDEPPLKAHATIPLEDPQVAKARYIHQEVVNPPEATNPGELLSSIDLYVARMVDTNGKTLSAVKRVTDFGKQLRNNRLAFLVGEELQIETRPKFQLSNEFDFVVDDVAVSIYRIKSFEAVCHLEEHLMEAMDGNIAEVQDQLSFVDLTGFHSENSQSIRMAREWAAIRRQGFCDDLSRDMVVAKCCQRNITYEEVDGKIVIPSEDRLKFIRLISRKSLEIQLREDEVEIYAVPSRRRE